MKSLIFAAAAACATALAAPASAAVQVLNFSGAICGAAGGQTCSNAGQISAAYGDTAELDVRYRAIDSVTGLPTEDFLRRWSSFGDLPGVAYAGGGAASVVEIFLKPAKGYEVSLLDFDFASFQRRVPNVPIRIGAGGGEVIQQGVFSTGGATHSSLAVNSDYFTSGIVLRFGPNGFDAGVDNIRFDVRQAAATPEPGAWALMLLGFGGMGAMLRRRRPPCESGLA